MEHWIWLPSGRYPDRQKTRLSSLLESGDVNYTVAEFKKIYDFGRRGIRSVLLRVSGDTSFILFSGNRPLFRGPAGVGGDFLFNDVLRQEYYATGYELTPEECPSLARGIFSLEALVRMGSVRICEYSRGEGGFFLEGTVFFRDGGEEAVFADESWRVRFLPAYAAPYSFDAGLTPHPCLVPERKSPPVATLLSPIPPCTEFPLLSEADSTISVAPGERFEKTVVLDKNYACYLSAASLSDAPARLKISGFEEEGAKDWEYDLRFSGRAPFYGMELMSAGGIRIEAVNEGTVPFEARIGLTASHYPVTEEARTVTSDEELNLVFDVCAHSLKYCRQTIHLDSPRHSEPLACTGDYYIETLMTAFTFGDMRLAEFDIHRTANLLVQHDGMMFHTTYSLIWVLMLFDVYRLTGREGLLRENEGALDLLLRRFAGYVGENGLIETPPNYMFVDWLVPDGINLHHPPKALGQTCLCLFYYGALKTAEEIYGILNEAGKAALARERRLLLGKAVLEQLWDPGRGLFFEGLNTPTDPSLIGTWMPENVEKRYFRKHANILAAYFGFFGDEGDRALLRRLLADADTGEVQPYFQHFLLDAVYRRGLREEYTLKLLSQWKGPVTECPKGLPEGFFKPTPTYSFDRSHAWAGTPAYALPLAVSGLRITKPGFREISLSPSSLGLDFAHAEIPTLFGRITVDAFGDGSSRTVVPPGIALREAAGDGGSPDAGRAEF